MRLKTSSFSYPSDTLNSMNGSQVMTANTLPSANASQLMRLNLVNMMMMVLVWCAGAKFQFPDETADRKAVMLQNLKRAGLLP